jgi:predicted MPP superfamily phosphohydrolase
VRSLSKLAAAASGTALAWGWFEAGWVRLRRRPLAVPGLPPELEGLRIAHLSDFHLGVPSRGAAAVHRAVEWVQARRPDIVALTGDLLTHPRGEEELRRLVERLPQPTFAVLGNHDLAIARDPMARPSNLSELQPARLLDDEGVLLDVRGRTVWVAGIHPRALLTRKRRINPNALTRDADLRILLCHFPRMLDRLEPGSFDLVLSGHMHDGQIAIPYGRGKVRLAHPTARYSAGVYSSRGTTMHVSPGLGTTFVPFRFAARPEATELVLARQR